MNRDTMSFELEPGDVYGKWQLSFNFPEGGEGRAYDVARKFGWK
jgi:hypothetical protein